MSQTNPAAIAEPKSASRRDLALLAGLFVLVLIGLAGLAAATGWEETKQQLAKLGPAQYSALIALSLVNYLFRGLRWHLFAQKLGLPLGLQKNLLHFVGGFAMTITPGRVGELIRMRWIKRETGFAFERTAPLVLMDRAADLAAIAIILALGISLGTGNIAFGVPVVILALGAAYLATRPALLAALATTTHRLVGRGARLFVKIRRAARALGQFSSARVLLGAIGLGLIGWCAEGYAFYLLLGWMGSGIDIWMAMAIFTFATLAGGLTGAPGGVGGAEAAMVALLSLQGVPLEVSIPATAIIRITTLWFAILLGLIIFPIAENQSRQAGSQRGV